MKGIKPSFYVRAKLFDFHPALETYIPKETRKLGYYAVNILYNGQIVGRLIQKCTVPKQH